MAVARLDVNGVLHHLSPIEAQLQATLNLDPVYAWYGSSEERIRIETSRINIYSIPALILDGETEVRDGNE